MITKKPAILEPDGSETNPIESESNSDITEVDVAEPDTSSSERESKPKTKRKYGTRQLSISVRSLVIATVIAMLVAGVAVLGWLYIGALSKLGEQAHQAQDATHAEELALDYAVNAAAMNYQDLNAWKGKLVAGTSPELNEKLSKAATSMEQILAPLQWSSTASPLSAKVVSQTGGVYVVDSFVSVLTKTMQSPEPLRSTATYSVTLDSNKDWQITDVGGVTAAVDQK